MAEKKKPQLYVIAGCNGAGKTTASFTVLPEMLNCREFVNADQIAAGLSPFNPEGVAIQAGRLMIDRIIHLLKEGTSFAFETTLSTRSYVKLIQQALPVVETRPAKLYPQFGHLPVWTEGNVYLAGAKACLKEINPCTANGEVKLDLVEKKDGIYLDTNIFELISDAKDRMINSDILGKAFEPQQRFEDKDGNDIIFDTDYFGAKRSDIIPGPFATLDIEGVNVVL